MGDTADANADFDRNRALSDGYEQGPRWFIPGYDASHDMAAVLLRDRIGDLGRILVLGAGGGVELSVFAGACEGWTFTGVDPSAVMLAQAQRKLAASAASHRVVWVRGSIEDAPRERFDAATAFLVLNFVRDDGRRLAALREIRARLGPGAPFLMINGCSEMGSPRFEEDLRLYASHARRKGAPAETIEGALRMQRESLCSVPPERERRLLAEAGFDDVRLFYAALWLRGWIASAA